MKNIRGRFLWHELMTSDIAAAEAFYTKVVGWKTQEWEQDRSYKMWMAVGRGMGGLMAMREEPNQVSPPPQWFSYIGTPDVDATVRQAVEIGGRVMKPAIDLPNVGRFAFLQDPQGAAFAVITPSPQPAPPPGDGKPGLGDFSWHELLTTNWQSAWEFYSKLFGWGKTSAMEMGPGQTYQMFGLAKGEQSSMGGFYNKPADYSGPPMWLPYAVVRDAKRTGEVVKQNGGVIFMGPMAVPGGDWIVAFVDRQGAAFAVHSKKKAAASKPASKPAKKSAAKAAKAKKSKPVKKSAKRAVKKPARKAAKRTVKKARRGRRRR
jgi:predicted enzyme related to lactoylglutathione lyase